MVVLARTTRDQVDHVHSPGRRCVRVADVDWRLIGVGEVQLGGAGDPQGNQSRRDRRGRLVELDAVGRVRRQSVCAVRQVPVGVCHDPDPVLRVVVAGPGPVEPGSHNVAGTLGGEEVATRCVGDRGSDDDAGRRVDELNSHAGEWHLVRILHAVAVGVEPHVVADLDRSLFAEDLNVTETTGLAVGVAVVLGRDLVAADPGASSGADRRVVDVSELGDTGRVAMENRRAVQSEVGIGDRHRHRRAARNIGEASETELLMALRAAERGVDCRGVAPVILAATGALVVARPGGGYATARPVRLEREGRPRRAGAQLVAGGDARMELVGGAERVGEATEDVADLRRCGGRVVLEAPLPTTAVRDAEHHCAALVELDVSDDGLRVRYLPLAEHLEALSVGPVVGPHVPRASESADAGSVDQRAALRRTTERELRHDRTPRG